MPTEPSPRAPRSDAVRNRRLLLDAAAVEFAEHGMDVSIDRIAHRAGLGKGTVFRHFTTKEQLAVAIAKERLEEYAAAGEALLAAPEPTVALREFMATGVALNTRDRSFLHAVGRAVRNEPGVRAVYNRITTAADALTDRARRASGIRHDVTGEDVLLLVGAAHQAAAPLLDADPELWRRYLGIIFDGLRPEGAHRLPHPPPSLRDLVG